MSRRRSLALVLALICAVAVPSGARGESIFDPSLPRVIVEFTEMPDEVRKRFADVGITHVALFPSADAAAVVGPESAYQAIAGWSEVVSVTPDAPLRLLLWQATETTRVNLVRVGAKPLKSAYTGSGVTVAVVDSGIDRSHPDLAGGKVAARLDFAPSRIFHPTTAALSDPAQQDPVLREPIYEPVGTDDAQMGHGTALADVIAGSGAAARGADMRGVAPDAMLVDLDVADAAFAYPSSIIAALEWLLKHNNDPLFPGGIRVATAAWGSPDQMPVHRRLLKRAMASGVVVVSAAGIEGSLVYPARYSEMISVKGACKDQDDWSGLCQPDRTSGLHVGESIDIVAPSLAVWAAYPSQSRWQGFNPVWLDSPVPGQGDPDDELNNRLWYGITSGDSIATAHVAGVAALMVEANPDLTHSEIEKTLQTTARDLGPRGFDASSGYGMVDAFNAVKSGERP